MNCEHCGAMLNAGSTSCTVCGTPVNAVATGVELAAPERVGMGILGALIGAILGGASIILLSRLGYVAAISGIITAFATLKGYELLGKRLSKTGVIVSVILMVLTPFLAYNVDLVWQLYDGWKEYGVTLAETIPLLVDVMAEDAELVRMYLSELGMIYLFAALGAFGIIRSALRNI